MTNNKKSEVMDLIEVWVGIDPGKTGAITFLSKNEIEIYDYEDLKGFLKLRELAFDPLQLYKIQCVIEKVGAMPKQGVASMFAFGLNTGIWHGRLEMAGVPFTLVTPQKWQKVIFDAAPKKNMNRKKMSLERARRLFPSTVALLSREKDHGRADALLIAEYCRRVMI